MVESMILWLCRLDVFDFWYMPKIKIKIAVFNMIYFIDKVSGFMITKNAVYGVESSILQKEIIAAEMS